MPPTKTKATVRYFQPEVSKVYYLPAIVAATLIPTRAEINAGIDLTAEIADLSGWSIVSGSIDTPDLASRFTSQISGRTKAEDSTITFYGDKTGDDVRKDLPRGSRGFMMFCDGGDVPTQPADVFPCEVSSVGKLRGVDEKAFQLTISFSVTRQPAEDVVIPAVI